MHKRVLIGRGHRAAFNDKICMCSYCPYTYIIGKVTCAVHLCPVRRRAEKNYRVKCIFMLIVCGERARPTLYSNFGQFLLLTRIYLYCYENLFFVCIYLLISYFIISNRKIDTIPIELVYRTLH